MSDHLQGEGTTTTVQQGRHETTDRPMWYVVHTYSGYENKVKANLEKSVENRGMQDLIQEVSVPMRTIEDCLTEDEAAELEQAADEAEAEGLLQEEIFIDGTEVEGQSSEEISVDENGNLSVAVPGPEDFEAQEGGAGDGI